MRLSAVFAMLLLACGGPSDQAEYSAGVLLEGSTGRATVDYQPNVKRVGRDAVRSALRAVSREGSTLLFDSLPQLGLLRAGDVLLIEGLLARKVLATEKVGDRLVVLTEKATLGDAVRDGRIEVEARVQFSGPPAPRSRSAGIGRRLAADVAGFLTPTLQAQSLKDLKAAAKDAVKGVYEGWDTEFSANPAEGRLNLSVRLNRDVGGFKAVITGDGYLADFDLDTDIDIRQGIVERLTMTHKRLNGVMNFRWEVAKDSPGPEAGEDRIKLPGAISIPLAELLGGFPLFLEISAAMIIHPAITGGKQYSRGAFRITYDGSQNFRIKEGIIDPEGSVTGDIEFLEAQNISALAPFGMVVALAVPRIEVTFGTSKVLDIGIIEKMPEEVAQWVDSAAVAMSGRLFGEEGVNRLKASLGGNLSLTHAVSNVLASDAAGYIELVSSTGMSHTGMSAIVPCTRHDLNFVVKVGGSVQALGQQIGKVGTDIFKRHVVRIDPPDARLCEAVGSSESGG